MISADDLVALSRSYNPRSDAAAIRAAYAFGEAAHLGQRRKSGEPYWIHPVAVAALLAEQQMDDATLVTALLHDTVEDNDDVTLPQIERLFGTEVAGLVDGVTKLTNIQLDRAGSEQAENFRKLFMATAKDLRVILVKLADRLHNMRTIRAMPEEKRIKKARETMDVFAPLAGRMGMQWMRDELEDLAFQVLDPVQRKSIIRRFATLHGHEGDTMRRITADIEAALEREGIEAEVMGRAKKPYSIWRKMQEKELAFERLSDIYGFRVITRSEGDCYRALGAIHHRWRAVPGRFKDYISQPKSNGYRSLHTTVSGRDGKQVEVQIRTREMHEVAQAGVAAHWSYRDGIRVENPFAVDPGAWLKEMSERFGEQADHEEFLEHVKLEMYADQVFCFTPKGEVVKLPRGATPIDFAYAIHTRIGDACVAAKVDGLKVPLWTRLRNGQQVRIVTAEGQRPEASWLDIVATGRAKAAIRRSLRSEDRERAVRFGRELVRAAFDQVGREASRKTLGAAAKRLALDGADELLARVGSGEMSAGAVVETLYPDRAQDPPHPEGPAILELENRAHHRAPCCQPLPGERIVGVPRPDRGVAIHAIDCAALEALEDAQWIDLHWGPGPHAPVHAVTLELAIVNEPTVLGRICTLIGERGANISDLAFTDRRTDYFRLRLDVALSSSEHLHELMAALEAERDVAELRRHRERAIPRLVRAAAAERAPPLAEGAGV